MTLLTIMVSKMSETDEFISMQISRLQTLGIMLPKKGRCACSPVSGNVHYPKYHKMIDEAFCLLLLVNADI